MPAHPVGVFTSTQFTGANFIGALPFLFRIAHLRWVPGQ